jgi:Uma2 family endonuclease
MTSELELYEQELEQPEMSTLEHSVIASTINREIGLFLKGKNLGRVFDGSAEYRFVEKQAGSPRKPARQPDLSFVSNERLPLRLRSYPHLIPDLVVEVASPSDLAYQIEAKIEEYQKAGVKLVWQVRPYSRQIDVYRLSKGLIPEPIGIEGELSGEDVLPGFRLPVVEIFDFPADPNPEPDK